MLSGKTYLKIFKKDFRVYPKNLKFITRRRHEKLHEDNSTVFKRFYWGCVWGGGKTWLGERAILQGTQPKKASLEASPMFHNIRIIVDSTNLLVRSKLSA